MNKKTQIYQYLDERFIDYQVYVHDPANTMQDIQAMKLLDHGEVPKNLFLRDKKGERHILLMIPSQKEADLKALGRKLGLHLSFASERRLEAYLNVHQGSISPLGIIYDDTHGVEVIIDSELQHIDKIGVHPCDNTATVFMNFGDLYGLIKEHRNPVTIMQIPCIQQ